MKRIIEQYSKGISIILKSVVKKSIYFFLFYTGLLSLALKIFSIIKKDHPCIILLYHRIVDDDLMYLNKGPAVHHHLRYFKKEIAFLKRNFQILTMDEVVEKIKSGSGFRKPSLAITFDDGYLDNFVLAYPILKKHKVPATIYLTTSLIGTSERTWTDQIEFALLETEKKQFNLQSCFANKTVKINTKGEKEKINIEIAKNLKLFPDTRRRELLKGLLENLDTNQNNLKKERLMLNWDEVKNMAKDGITIGSHTHTHPILTKMQIKEAEEDIFSSKKIIEENLGMHVKHFAFPNGREEDFSEELRDYCQEIGFKSVSTGIYGANNTSKKDTFALKRVGAISPVWMLAGTLFVLLIKSKGNKSEHLYK